MDPRPFKVRARVKITAHDRSDQPFFFGEMWRVVATAKTAKAAEDICRDLRDAEPRNRFRVEDWSNHPFLGMK